MRKYNNNQHQAFGNCRWLHFSSILTFNSNFNFFTSLILSHSMYVLLSVTHTLNIHLSRFQYHMKHDLRFEKYTKKISGFGRPRHVFIFENVRQTGNYILETNQHNAYKYILQNKQIKVQTLTLRLDNSVMVDKLFILCDPNHPSVTQR